MTTLCLYITHNKNIVAKAFSKLYSDSLVSNNIMQTTYLVTALYTADAITIMSADSRLAINQTDFNFEAFYAEVDRIKQKEGITNLIISIDANLGIAAHETMTAEVINCINRLSKPCRKDIRFNYYLTLFSTTPKCLDDAKIWLEQPDSFKLPTLNYVPKKVYIEEKAINALSNHFKLIDQSFVTSVSEQSYSFYFNSSNTSHAEELPLEDTKPFSCYNASCLFFSGLLCQFFCCKATEAVILPAVPTEQSLELESLSN